jgi:signal transduction histidine kinase/CheY-like chemotaxis protein/CHASE3 domain sensor protein
MKSSFKRNLFIGYGLSLLLLLVSAIASFVSINSLLKSADEVNHTSLVINKLEYVTSVLKDAETGQRGYLLTGENVFLEPYHGSQNKAYSLIDEVKTLTSDNPEQQQTIEKLRSVVTNRLALLQLLIDARRGGRQATVGELQLGKKTMDEARALVRQMQDREKALLSVRNAMLQKFSASTPILIVVSALLAIMATVISFKRVTKDFNKREALQKELQQKDADITSRIASIQKIAERISSGDYATRVSDEEKDNLGSLSFSLNKMASSLQTSFTQLQEKEWLQTGIASLNDVLIGDKDTATLSNDFTSFVTEYTRSNSGAFYTVNEEGRLKLESSYALPGVQKGLAFELGQGLAGQAGLSQKIIETTSIKPEDYTISFTAGNIKPRSVIALPIMYNGRLMGVLELTSLEQFIERDKSFFQTVSINVGIAIHSAKARQRVLELLEKTQAQSEELQAQHSELEDINTELEAQSEKLQASEEELRVQQEELQQANSELEERSRLLEEKNEMIAERNVQIQAKAEALEVSTKYKSEFLANMSHELRTPLNSILLLSRLLSDNTGQNLSPDQVEYARVIQTSGNGLLALIDEILDLSKIEAGKMELEYQEVFIEDMLKELKALFTPVAVEKKIQFKVEADADLPKLIETDRMRLEQIMRNLISNAIKFTAEGSVTLHVKKENKGLAFIVSDTGIGIAKEKQQSIFEAFQQADGSTRRRYGGTGLGLSISRELAKILGGEIHLKSEEGKGSEFKLIIPIQNETSLPAKQAQGVKQGVYTLPEAAELPADKKYNTNAIPAAMPDDRKNIVTGDKVLLIIEDDTAFAKSLLDYTRQKGYKGIVAVRGDEGIQLAAEFLPLGILLDIQLPVKNGWEVMEELKRNPVTRPIPVHMMSSYSERIKSLSEGAVDFIDKPMAFERLGEVFQKIEQALTRYPKKVLIVEENPHHAKALAFYLQSFDVASEIKNTVTEGIEALNHKNVDCVILDTGIPGQQGYDLLEEVKKTPGFENLPIIVFTGKNLSNAEEMKIKKYADSIVIKTAHSYQRILDEVSLFLHLVEENKTGKSQGRYKKMGALTEVLKDKTVLIADDDVRNIFSLTKALENYGMNVLSAVDGNEALKQLEEASEVDIVLMDMMMPEMDGYESTKRIREKWQYRNLPIIAVTAKAMTGDREKCIEAGASDYVTKPVDIDQLTSLLRVWLYDKG